MNRLNELEETAFWRISPTSRLVALQQALIRINSHSIIFLLSKHLCISESPAYSFNTQGQLFPSSLNRNSFVRLQMPIFSLSLPHVRKHKDNNFILPNAAIFFLVSIAMYNSLSLDNKQRIVCKAIKKAKNFISSSGVWSSNIKHLLWGREMLVQHRKGRCWPHESPFSLGLLMKTDTACLTAPHSHYLVKQPP